MKAKLLACLVAEACRNLGFRTDLQIVETTLNVPHAFQLIVPLATYSFSLENDMELPYWIRLYGHE